MPVPPDPVLRAAVRWLEHLPTSGLVRCRALFTTSAAYSDISPTQYDHAYTWLRTVDLLEAEVGCGFAAQTVFEAAVKTGAAWFADADVLVTAADDLPADALRAAEALGIADEAAYAYVRTAWGKVDTAQRERVGAAGELAVVKLLAEAVVPGVAVEHVAAEADGFGYDIAVRAPDGNELHLEVKATTRRGRLSVYLSRNEHEVMRRDRAWQLVAVRLSSELEPIAVASVPASWLAENAPFDRGPAGRWESCCFDIPPEILEPGVAALWDMLGVQASPLLAGSVQWAAD